MEKQKNTQMFVIAILAVALLTMSVGFAGFSQVLNISGTANVKAASWNIHFNNTSYALGTNSVSEDSKTITGTAMTYTTTLTKPGDKYEFTIDVENTGTFDATLTSMTVSSLDSAVDEYLDYVVTYDSKTPDAAAGSTLAATNGTATVKVVVTYVQPSDSSKLPTVDTPVTLTCVLNYDQKTA